MTQSKLSLNSTLLSTAPYVYGGRIYVGYHWLMYFTHAINEFIQKSHLSTRIKRGFFDLAFTFSSVSRKSFAIMNKLLLVACLVVLALAAAKKVGILTS